ncbi:MAG: hypothetical protein CM15mP73_1110 [Hyphomicrobiales bacterium]|nr:MAG: hypothetical protein CM15mP73_1110 [Hyphomicrobiales bacterium]
MLVQSSLLVIKVRQLKKEFTLARELNSNITIECDVSDEASIINLINEIEKVWGQIDFIVHAIAYSDKNELTQIYRNLKIIFTNNAYILLLIHICCETRTKILKDQSSLLTLTYSGAEG